MENDNLFYQLKKQWYVAYTHARSEGKVAGQLAKRGVKFFLPMRQITTKTRAGMRDLAVPLFSNYIFVFTSSNRIPSLLPIPGIDRFVSFGDNPVPVPSAQIAAIREACFPTLKAESKLMEIQKDTSTDNRPKRGIHITLQSHIKNVA